MNTKNPTFANKKFFFITGGILIRREIAWNNQPSAWTLSKCWILECLVVVGINSFSSVETHLEHFWLFENHVAFNAFAQENIAVSLLDSPFCFSAYWRLRIKLNVIFYIYHSILLRRWDVHVCFHTSFQINSVFFMTKYDSGVGADLQQV